MSIKKLMLVICVGLLALGSILHALWPRFSTVAQYVPAIVQGSKAEAHLTVFIHGSIFTGLSLTEVNRVRVDNLSDDMSYVKLIKLLRDKPGLGQDQMMGKYGWHDILPSGLTKIFNATMTDQERKQGSFFILPAYHSSLCSVRADTAHHHYATFGHYGLLSYKYRYQEAYRLYDALCAKVTQLKKMYDKITITLIAHSHGGNIALNVAAHELDHDRGLQIDELILFGTPIQKKVAPLAYSGVFKKVISCYADKDWVQDSGASWFEGKCYKTFAAVNSLLDKKEDIPVHDVRMTINQGSTHQKIDHANMWLVGRSHPVSDILDPLPVMVFAPRIVDAINSCDHGRHHEWRLMINPGDIHGELYGLGEKVPYFVGDNCYDTITSLRDLARRWWAPDSSSRDPVANKHYLNMIYSAFKELYGDEWVKTVAFIEYWTGLGTDRVA